MLAKLNQLFNDLNSSDIRYCHWKSNSALAESLDGQTDVDLLVHRRDAYHFRMLLSQHRFKTATLDAFAALPSVDHYVGLDEMSGRLIHVHVYYRVITGESLAKNYHFPIEDLLLQCTRYVDCVRVPIKNAEMLVFTLRMMLKHTSILELGLLSRYWRKVSAEIQWLQDSSSVEQTLELLSTWLPVIDRRLFLECIRALSDPAPLWRRVLLAIRLRRQIQPYARHSALTAWWSGTRKFGAMLVRRLAHSKVALTPNSGGAVIAFVGSEATGKSTLIAAVNQEFGKCMAVERVHAGKPKTTLLGAIPNMIVPVLRLLFPTLRSTRIAISLQAKAQTGSVHTPHGRALAKGCTQTKSRYPIVFAIRSLLLAYDRRALLIRSFRRAANGTIILCDRYPSLDSGAPDSPQLTHLPDNGRRLSFRRLLAQAERRLYQQIPPPDLVIYLHAPLHLTLARNASRDKTEDEDYVRWRHSLSNDLTFGNTSVYNIETDQSLDQTVLEVKKAIWNAL